MSNQAYSQATQPCPQCHEFSKFSAKRGCFYCAECELAFEAHQVAAAPGSGGRVFLSYGHDPECTELARQIKKGLEPEFVVWMDESTDAGGGIRFGDDWRQRIVSGIRQSQHMLALLSGHSTRKPGVCREEVALALGPLKSHVYSVLVQPVSEVTPPLILSQRQWLDMSDWRTKRGTPEFESWFADHLAEIVRVLRTKSNFAGDMEELNTALKPLSQVSNHMESERGFYGRHWLLGRLGLGRASLQSDQADPDEEPLGEIERWAIDEPQKRIFWLCAEPGWGKSAVMGRLAHAQRARVLAVHFCRHDEADTRHPQRVICSLAYQMASQLEDYRGCLLAMLRSRTPDQPLMDAKPGDLFRQLIQEPLAHTIDGGRAKPEGGKGEDAGQHQRRLIVIDALDECIDANGRSELLDILAERFKELPAWLGLVVSSRREAPLVAKFRAYGMFEMAVFEEQNRLDIRHYAEEWLKGVVQQKLLSTEQYSQALNSVCEAAAGNFLYLRQLEQGVMQDGVVKPEELLNSAHLPAGLGGMYTCWFERRFESVDHYEKSALPLLELLLASMEPLPLSLARQILGWDERQQAKVLATMGSLLRHESGTLQFFHKSLADWVQDEEAAGPNWLAGAKAGHIKLCDSLLNEWRHDQKAASRSDIKGLSRYFAEWSADARTYALRHLPTHLWMAGRNEEHQDVLTDFSFALQRCQLDVLENLLSDYRQARIFSRGTPLHAWADAACTQAHLLKRGSEDWPAHKIWLQIASYHADDSPLTLAAEAWLNEGNCDWTWLRKVNRPKKFIPSPLLAVMEGHALEVTGAQVFPDGRILSWSYEKTLRLWDGQSGAPLAVMAGHTEAVHGAQILPDGRVLSWSTDGTLRLWDGKTGEPLAVMEGHNDWVSGASFQADGRVLSWSEDGTLRLWDGQTGRHLLKIALDLEEQENSILGGRVLPDGRILSWSSDRTLRLWDGKTGAHLNVFEGHTKRVWDAQLLDNHRILSWSCDGSLRLWDEQSGAPLMVIEGRSYWLNCIQMVNDGRILVWGDGLRLLDGQNGATLTVMEEDSDWVSGARVLADGRILSWKNDMLRLWDAKTGKLLATMSGDTKGVSGAQVLPTGRIISWYEDATSTGGDSTLRLWDVQSGKLLMAIDGHTKRVKGVHVLADGRILSWSDDKTLRLWDVNSVTPLATEGHTENMNGAQMMPDGRVVSWSGEILSPSQDNSLRLWDTQNGNLLAVMKGHTDGVSGAQVLPDSRILSWSGDGTLRLWDGQSGKLLALMEGHTESVKGARALSDGRILSWSYDNTLCLWDGHSGALLAVMDGHTGIIDGAIELRPGRILSWSFDKTLRLWNADTGAPLAVMDGHTNEVRDAQVMQDGHILSLSCDNTLRLWDGQNGVQLAMMGGHTEQLAGAKQLPDGRILSWSWSGSLRLWDCNGAPLAVIEGYADALKAVHVLADGHALLLNNDKTVCLWDGLSMEPMHKWHRSTVLFDPSFPAHALPHIPNLKCILDWYAVGLDRSIKWTDKGKQPRDATWLCDGEYTLTSLTPGGTIVAYQGRNMTFLKPYHGSQPLTVSQELTSERAVGTVDRP